MTYDDPAPGAAAAHSSTPEPPPDAFLLLDPLGASAETADDNALDLTVEGLGEWLATLDPFLLEQISDMTGHEAWPIDHPAHTMQEALQHVAELGQGLQALASRGASLQEIMEDPQARRDMVHLLAYLTPARRLRLVSWLVERGDLSGDFLALEGGQSPEDRVAQLTVRRSIQRLQRQNLLTSLFHPDRMARLAALLKGSAS